MNESKPEPLAGWSMPARHRSNSPSTRVRNVSSPARSTGSASALRPRPKERMGSRSRRPIWVRNRRPPRPMPCRAVLAWGRTHLGGRRLDALGHRVVHGGMNYSRPERVTAELMAELEALIPLAPLHQPYNLAPIRTAVAAIPSCRRSPASIRRFTEACRKSRRPLRSRWNSIGKASGVTASMGFRMNTLPLYCPR